METTFAPSPAQVGGLHHPLATAAANLDNLPEINSYTTPQDLEVLRQVREARRNSGTVILAERAIKDGASVEWLGRELAISKKDNQHFIFSTNRGPATPVGVALVKDKLATKNLLEQAGVAAPRGIQVSNARKAIEFHKRIGSPVVVKPRSGNLGSGVSVNLSDPNDIT